MTAGRPLSRFLTLRNRFGTTPLRPSRARQLSSTKSQKLIVLVWPQPSKPPFARHAVPTCEQGQTWTPRARSSVIFSLLLCNSKVFRKWGLEANTSAAGDANSAWHSGT